MLYAQRRALIVGLLSIPIAAKAREVGPGWTDPPRESWLSAPLKTLPEGETPPPWRRYAVPPPVGDDRPAITIVIDDMGVIHPGTERAIVLPGPLTLSWFPFAPRLAEQVAAGAARGHETTLHMPMQASPNTPLQVGPDPLRVDLPAEVNLARLRAAMAAVPRAVGLNNHMGTVATHDPALMDIVATETREQGMLFLDSVTIPHSVALQRAELAGVPTAARDVFIDNSAHPADIAVQLESIEAIARRFGHVIAIGHPRPHTLDALETWLPGLPGRGFALWPLAATIARRNGLPLVG
jgi:polysaccharide deacetylase 2 family uncharacterized protein YibQ